MVAGLRSCQNFVLILTVLLLTACGSEETSQTTGNRISPTYQGPPEEAYCSDVQTFSSSVTITGSAEFEYRDYVISGLGAVQSGSNRKPIRFAEIRVLNSSGNITQCSQTDANGDFSFTLPINTGSYTLQVNSRGLNDNVKATIFNRPEQNQFYSLTMSVSSASDGPVGTLVASATGDVVAGAFNILDQIVEANIYLVSTVGSGDCGSDGCTEINVAEKVSVYWQKGFNPGEYINGSPLSYYVGQGFRRLFILGGINGDVDNTDTDHFDNTIILHEYGHFLEDVYFGTDTPGGPHNGNSLIDPRLAWSEAWSNLLQGVVRNEGNYKDTQGNVNGDTRYLISLNFENNSSTVNDHPKAGLDNNKGYGTRGEGNFREFSVTRLLWDSVDDNNDSETITGGFPEMWTSLTNSSFGWNNSRWQFRSVGAFHKIHEDRTGSTDWSVLRDIEKQAPNRKEYAQYLEVDNSCPDADYYVMLSPGIATSATPSTDYFNDHDFYHLKLDSVTSGSLTVEWTDQDGSSTTNTDLDLYVYDKDARLWNTDDRIAYTIEQNSGGPPITDSAVLASEPAGNYLIDVFVWTGGGNPVRYGLKLNGDKLCQKDPP